MRENFELASMGAVATVLGLKAFLPYTQHIDSSVIPSAGASGFAATVMGLAIAKCLNKNVQTREFLFTASAAMVIFAEDVIYKLAQTLPIESIPPIATSYISALIGSTMAVMSSTPQKNSAQPGNHP